MSGLCPGCTNTCPVAAFCRDDAVDVIEGEIVEEAESLEAESGGSLEKDDPVAAVAPASPKEADAGHAREPHGDEPQSSQNVRNPSDGVVAPDDGADDPQDDHKDAQEDKPVRPQNVYHAPTDKRRCKAKSKTTGNQCKNWALPGLKVCRFHGAGGTHPSRLEGEIRVQKEKRAKKLKAQAETILAHEGLKPVEDPILELGKLAAASQEMVRALGKRVNALRSVEHYDAKNSVQLRAEVELYERAMDRTGNLLDKLVKHGYTERLVQIEEAETMLILGVLNRALSRLQLAPEQLKQAKAYLAEEFRALEPRKLDGGR